MPPRMAGIPHHRERASLQSIKDRNWVIQADLYPAGEGTIASMLRKGWIERRVDPAGVAQFRITEAGKAALVAKIPAGPSER
jgi:DNA-binding PadR family transcriptional regulator